MNKCTCFTDAYDATKAKLFCCHKTLCDFCWSRMFHADKKLRLYKCPFCHTKFESPPKMEIDGKKIHKKDLIGKRVSVSRGRFKCHRGTIAYIERRHDKIQVSLETSTHKQWFFAQDLILTS